MTLENATVKQDETAQLHLSQRFTNAVDYARRIHTERRKGTEIPYMAHLLGVAALVMGEAGHAWLPVNEDMVIAALLHDAAEDHGGATRLKDIADNFGSEVARMVAGLSDSLVENANEKSSWEELKRTYIQKLLKEPADVRLISVADKLFNARTILEDYREIGSLIWERFKRKRKAQLWYFDQLLEVYKTFAEIRIVDEFGRVLAELRQNSASEVHYETRKTF
jgi:(p)ppGpp synthase/HD superfamily hydrolase